MALELDFLLLRPRPGGDCFTGEEWPRRVKIGIDVGLLSLVNRIGDVALEEFAEDGSGKLDSLSVGVVEGVSISINAFIIDGLFS